MTSHEATKLRSHEGITAARHIPLGTIRARLFRPAGRAIVARDFSPWVASPNVSRPEGGRVLRPPSGWRGAADQGLKSLATPVCPPGTTAPSRSRFCSVSTFRLFDFSFPVSTFRRFGVSTFRGAFTLVEMVVVIAVILILVGLVLPAATTMWNQRKVADAQNTIQGMLRTTRAKAAQGQRGDMGVLFYVDSQGIQRLATIARNPFDPDNPPAFMQNPTTKQFIAGAHWRTDQNWRDVYTVTGQPQGLPTGMRAVPQYALITENEAQTAQLDPYEFFTNVEMANDDFANPPSESDSAQRHRNFFAVLFSADGRLITDREVLVREVDADAAAAAPTTPPSHNPANPAYFGYGDITGFKLAPAATPATKYTKKDGTAGLLPPNYGAVDSLVVDPNDASTALNFVPVDGLLVYDDSLFREAGTPAEKRTVLQATGQPFYVHHLTGAIVKGPSGENESQ